jgi:preprotein translocase SecY subunit
VFKTFRNAWQIPELRKRLLFTLLILVVYRLGCAIPVPFISSTALTQMFGTGSMLTYLNMMSGGALSEATLFALGVIPYINASIIIQLLCVAIPYLENLAKEPDGQQKLQQITRYTGAGIALVMSIGYYFVLRSQGSLTYATGAAGWFTAFVVILAFAGGAQLITWCGEQIDDKGIGNGVSLLIFVSIVSRWSSLYSTVTSLLTEAKADKPQYYILLPVLVLLALAVVVFIIILTNAERRIPVQYAKRVVGRKMMGGQNSYIPLKINMSGVMPIIFASAMVSIPGTIMSFFNLNADPEAHPFWYAFYRAFNYTSVLYIIVYLLLILAFNYFYVAIQYNPIEIANNLRQNNGTIPGIRPGKPTSDFITKTLGKVTLIGAIFLACVAVLPIILGNVTGVSIQLGGTSLLIVVGVALDTSRSLDSFMTMRNHKGFLG